MVYVVERYLPGLGRADLLPGLSRLEPAIEELRGTGAELRYLGSTIVLGDEACFCQFEARSEAAVAEANRRAGLPFDRIVPALLIHSYQRRSEMSLSSSVAQTARRGRSRRLVIVVVLAVVVALAAWAITTYAVNSDNGVAKRSAPTPASVLSTLSPQQQQYVRGLAAMTFSELAAAFGTGR
jgi:Nickel responsive protein SCO4226-like